MKTHCSAAILFLVLNGTQVLSAPKLKSVSVSTFSVFDYWESENFVWKNSSNTPALLAGIKWSALIQLSERTGFFISLPLQYSRSGKDNLVRREVVLANGQALIPDSWVTVEKPVQRKITLGDMELGTGLGRAAWRYKLRYWIPTGYIPGETESLVTRDTVPAVGVLYDLPWKGFGVHRVGFSVSYSNGPHYLDLQTMWVVYRPKGDKQGLVEPGDFMFSTVYSKSAKLSQNWVLKPAVGTKFSNFYWMGFVDNSRWDLEVNLGSGLSYRPAWNREISLSLGAAVWGRTSEAGTTVNSPRKVTLGLYYGNYW